MEQYTNYRVSLEIKTVDQKWSAGSNPARVAQKGAIWQIEIELITAK